jgi:hypothetical protein
VIPVGDAKHCIHRSRAGFQCDRARGPCRCGLPKSEAAAATLAAQAASRAQPAPPPANKECRECGRTLLNTPVFFGLRLSGDRHTLATVGVCKDCTRSKQSEAAKARWARYR